MSEMNTRARVEEEDSEFSRQNHIEAREVAYQELLATGAIAEDS